MAELAAITFAVNLPFHEEAERAVLGALLIFPERLRRIDELLPEHFYFERNRLLFSGILRLADDGEPVDPFTLQAHLGAERWEQVGGHGYVAGLDVDLPAGVEALREWAGLVREYASRRASILAALELARRAEQGQEFGLAMERHATRIESLRSAAPAGIDHWHELGAVMAEDDVLAPWTAGETLRQAATGLPTIDRAGILGEGTLTLVVGRTGTGKSCLALQIARNSAIERGIPTGVISLEMNRAELLRRILAATARVNYTSLRRRDLADFQRYELRQQLARVQNAPLFIDDRESQSTGDVARQVRRLKTRHPDSFLFVVDYLSLLQLPGEGRERHDLRLGMASTALARLARELRIAMVLVCQLGRRGEQEKRSPVLTDISDSDAVARDAYAVLAIHRPYEERRPGILAQSGHVALLKHRGGEQAQAEIRFDGCWQSFREVDSHRSEEGAERRQEGA